MNNIIPPITDPLGSHWSQPKVEDILIDDHCALMKANDLRKLKEYSTTLPTGVYAGKMWKSQYGGIWYLRWYGESENPNMCSNNQREIILI